MYSESKNRNERGAPVWLALVFSFIYLLTNYTTQQKQNYKTPFAARTGRLMQEKKNLKKDGIE
jgi:hypothetical protein